LCAVVTESELLALLISSKMRVSTGLFFSSDSISFYFWLWPLFDVFAAWGPVPHCKNLKVKEAYPADAVQVEDSFCSNS
jgi:hypothetical protein